jgi:hypothetical protein
MGSFARISMTLPARARWPWRATALKSITWGGSVKAASPGDLSGFLDEVPRVPTQSPG